jgi:hypothetical protein
MLIAHVLEDEIVGDDDGELRIFPVDDDDDNDVGPPLRTDIDGDGDMSLKNDTITQQTPIILETYLLLDRR